MTSIYLYCTIPNDDRISSVKHNLKELIWRYFRIITVVIKLLVINK